LGGYSTTLHEIAQASLEGLLDIRPQAVTLGGEPLSEEAAVTIEKTWGAVPMQTYASSEPMCLALELPGREGLTLFEDEHIFEILDAEDREVAPAETGRMIMTNLYNRAMPLIRYDMGDYVTRGSRPSHERFDSILRVEGRVNDARPLRLDDGSVDSLHPIVLSEFFVPGAWKFHFVSESTSEVVIRYLAAEQQDGPTRDAFTRLLAIEEGRDFDCREPGTCGSTAGGSQDGQISIGGALAQGLRLARASKPDHPLKEWVCRRWCDCLVCRGQVTGCSRCHHALRTVREKAVLYRSARSAA
jgi:hypothetical protein